MALGAVASLAMAALAGCVSTSTSGTGTSTEGPTAVTTGGGVAPKDLAGNVVWWGYTPGSPVNEQYIAQFNKDYPNIKVTWKQTSIDDYDAAVRPALGNSSGLDVYQMSAGSANGGVAVFGGSAIDLTPAVQAALGSDWKSKLATTGVSALTVDGQLKALAAGAVFAGTIWINQDLFDKYGLTPPKTYDDWKNVCATFKKNNVEVVTLTSAEFDAWVMIAQASSYKRFADEVPDGKKLIDEALAVIRDAVAEGLIEPCDPVEKAGAFAGLIEGIVCQCRIMNDPEGAHCLVETGLRLLGAKQIPTTAAKS